MNVTSCCLCNSSNLKKVVTLGSSGLANNLEPTKDASNNSKKYPLDLLFCNDCNHVQLGEEVDPKILFSNYRYETGISKYFRSHFKEYAEDVVSQVDSNNPFVVDVGSNDCSLLGSLKDVGCKTIGIEPATNLVEKYGNEFNLINSFLTDSVAKEVVSIHGEVDVVTANNVFAHNRNLRGFVESVKILLKDNGLFFIEVQYLSNLIKNGYFDMVYHEHTSYHHIKPLRLMMDSLGMKLIDAKNVSTHGGSIRLVFQKTDSDIDFSNELVELDNIFDQDIISHLDSLNQSVEEFKIEFRKAINALSIDYDCIYGYAAPAKVVTLLSLFDEYLTGNIDFIIDDSKLKQGKYLPGYGIEIIGTDQAVERLKNTTNACIIFAWNVAEDIKKNILSSDLDPDIIVIPLPKLEIS